MLGRGCINQMRKDDGQQPALEEHKSGKYDQFFDWKVKLSSLGYPKAYEMHMCQWAGHKMMKSSKKIHDR